MSDVNAGFDMGFAFPAHERRKLNAEVVMGQYEFGAKQRVLPALSSPNGLRVIIFSDGGWYSRNGKAGGGAGTFGSDLSLNEMRG